MILVTGGAGYIGSHFLLSCLDRGIAAVAVDDLSTGDRTAIPAGVPFVKGDIGDPDTLDRIFARWPIRQVVHFAARISVPESFLRPADYYRTNSLASAALLDASVRYGVEGFVFSSTAAVYGDTDVAEVSETSPTSPQSPYGRSKLAVEWMMQDMAATGALRIAVLRYFNVAGADPAGRARAGSAGARHLIANVARVARGEAEALHVFGADYDTRDGTCIRDFIHVSDLCDAHMIALQALADGATSLLLNCGSGTGLSVREVVEGASRHLGATLPHRDAPRRKGDIVSLVARSERLHALGWIPRLSNVDDILRTALPTPPDRPDPVMAAGQGTGTTPPAACHRHPSLPTG